MNDILRAIGQQGVLANVSVRYWRAAKKLEPADLGLSENQIAGRLFNLGHKRLLPKDALARFALIEGRAHAVIEKASFIFLGGIARFVPNRNLEKLSNMLNGLRDEFAAEVETFMSRYDELRESALAEWREAAGGLHIPPDELLGRIESCYPSAIKLRESFRFETHYYQVQAPESLRLEAVEAADQMAVAQARASVAHVAALKLSQDAELFVADCVASLREQTAHICDEMLSSMRDGKTEGVHQKTLNRLMRFIDEFRNLSFAGDGELEGILAKARRELLSQTAEEFRNNASAQARLTPGLKRLGDEARKLASQESREIIERFGQMGVRRFNLAA